jgi:hypothetical protein
VHVICRVHCLDRTSPPLFEGYGPEIEEFASDPAIHPSYAHTLESNLVLRRMWRMLSPLLHARRNCLVYSEGWVPPSLPTHPSRPCTTSSTRNCRHDYLGCVMLYLNFSYLASRLTFGNCVWRNHNCAWCFGCECCYAIPWTYFWG